MASFFNSIYPALGSTLYFLALIWVLILGADHAGSRPRHARRAWGRIRPGVWVAAVAWAVMTATLVVVPSQFLIPGVNLSLFEGFQITVAWVAFPAGLWFVARAGTGAGRAPARWILFSGIVGIVAVVFSQLEMIPFHPQLSPQTEKLFTPVAWRGVGLIASVLLAAPVEEILFRLVIQGRLEVWAARHGWTGLVPVVLTSFLWTMGHAGMVEPRGVKELQIFILGLLLGWTRRRWGISGSILAHGVLNSYACISQIIQWIHP